MYCVCVCGCVGRIQKSVTYQRGLAFDENNERLETELEICLDKILEENGDYL